MFCVHVLFTVCTFLSVCYLYMTSGNSSFVYMYIHLSVTPVWALHNIIMRV